MDLETWRLRLEILSYLVTIVGLPAAIFLFLRQRQRELRDLELTIFDAPHREYIDYLRLCMEYPHLDVADTAHDVTKTPDEHQTRLAFTILIATMERAFLLYSLRDVRQQWAGWDAYIRDWAAQERFQRLWPLLGPQFDQRFVTYLDEMMPSSLRTTAIKAEVEELVPGAT